MSPDSPAPLVDALRLVKLLEPAQLDELAGRLATRFPDRRALVAELVRRQWLTTYQVDQLLQGRGADLLLGSYVVLDRLGEGGFGADGKRLASNGGDFAKDHIGGWIWDVAEKKQVVPLPSVGYGRTSWIGWNTEGGLASMTDDGFGVLYDPRSGGIVARADPYSQFSSPTHSASWAPDGRHIADSAGRICEVSKVGREITLTGPQMNYQALVSVAWSPDGKRLASGSWDGIVRLWDADGAAGPVLRGMFGSPVR